jgi:hypothetical protein
MVRVGTIRSAVPLQQGRFARSVALLPNLKEHSLPISCKSIQRFSARKLSGKENEKTARSKEITETKDSPNELYKDD